MLCVDGSNKFIGKTNEKVCLLKHGVLPAEWYSTLDMLKESCRIASSANWSDVDLSQFQGIHCFNEPGWVGRCVYILYGAIVMSFTWYFETMVKQPEP